MTPLCAVCFKSHQTQQLTTLYAATDADDHDTDRKPPTPTTTARLVHTRLHDLERRLRGDAQLAAGIAQAKRQSAQKLYEEAQRAAASKVSAEAELLAAEARCKRLNREVNEQRSVDGALALFRRFVAGGDTAVLQSPMGSTKGLLGTLGGLLRQQLSRMQTEYDDEMRHLSRINAEAHKLKRQRNREHKRKLALERAATAAAHQEVAAQHEAKAGASASVTSAYVQWAPRDEPAPLRASSRGSSRDGAGSASFRPLAATATAWASARDAPPAFARSSSASFRPLAANVSKSGSVARGPFAGGRPLDAPKPPVSCENTKPGADTLANSRAIAKKRPRSCATAASAKRKPAAAPADSQRRIDSFFRVSQV
jgi:hypothetical protein